ncbi:MAG: hypothetical protein Kow00120_29440 [Anaerolineae bacterium]
MSETAHDRPWLKHYDYWVPATINYPHMPVGRLLEIASIVYPHHTATLFFDAEMTYAQLRAEVARLATALRDLGLGKGDRIGVMLSNSPQYVIAYYAAQWIGATVVNMSTLWVAREVARVVESAEMAALFVEEALAPKALSARAGTALAHVIVVRLEAYMPEGAAAAYVASQQAQGGADLPAAPWLHRWEDLMQTEPRPFRVEIDPVEDVAVLQYTGGTTGAPKAAMLTHYGMIANIVQAAVWAGPYANDGNETFLCVVPFSHAYGMNAVMNRAIFHGYRMALVPQFDINMLIDVIRKYQPTHFYSVPALLRAILGRRQAEADGVKSLKFVGTGSSPLPRDLMMHYEARMDGMFVEGYGLTEAGPVATLWHIFSEPNRESVGLPFPDTVLKIVDAEDGACALPPGEVGEIVISGPQLMKGYWKQPEETARVLRTDAQGVRWLYTGDIGYMDEAGYLYVVDRKKDTIIVAGYNVYPSEIESVLLEHPAVAEAAVIGVDDRARGQRIEAYVVLAPGATVTEQALLDHCKANMAPYKIPRRVIFRESLPKNAVGKVRRAELARAEAEAAADRPDFTITPAPPDVTPEGFFTELLPRDFAAYVAAHPPGDALDGTTFTVQYTVDGAVYALYIIDGRALRVTREAAPSPDITVTTDLESWRDSVTGRVFTGLSPVAQGATAQRRAKLAEVRGTVHLELTRADGSLYRATATYNGETGAAVVIRMSTADYSDMQRGRLSGAEALMSGKLQAQGDLGVLQALAALRA